MAIKKLQTLYPQPLPQFDIPEKYKKDEWDIKEWDYFKEAHINSKSSWRSRSNITDHKFKFTICKNPYIVEEYKYFMYFLIEVRRIELRSFAEYYDRYKVLAEYVEKYLMNYTSILDLEDTSHFETFLINHKGNKTSLKNGQHLVDGKLVPAKRKTRFATFITYSQSIIREYYEKDIPETQKLVWHVQKFPFVKDQDVGKNLDFRNITNPHTLKNVQTFCKYQLEVCSITFGSTYRYLHSIKIFSEWLDNFYASSDLDKLNRDVLEEYMLYLRTCGKYSSHESNLNIQNLKVFFEWGAFHEMKHMPKDVLLISSDFAIKSKKESRYLTDDELRGVISVIPMMPKLYGKMLYCLIFLGVRYSELAKLSIDCIKQNEDGTYYLDLWQYKTDVFYEKPVYQNCIKIIKNEIELNKKRFGEDLTYVFVSNKNKPIGIKSMNDNIQKALIKGNVKGRDGKILHCTTHQFRATLATNLISEGVAVKVASELLGQTNPRSINHYVAITQDKVKEYLKPRLEKDERLIRNIGKMEELKEIPTEETVALCNGFCSKNPLTTPCAKANACFSCPLFIPSKQFLNMYEMQLLEIEATIKIAETNGYDLMLEKAIEDQNAILNILKRLEQIGGKSNDNERKENDRNKET